MRKIMKNNRIESYLVLAATPAVIGSIATAEVYHYDGPAISVSTNGLPSNGATWTYASFAVGGGSLIGTIFMDVNAWRNGATSGYGRSAGFEAGGSSKVYGGFVAQEEKGSGGLKPNAQRFSYSAKMPGKSNFPSPKAKIGGSSHGDTSGFGDFNGEDEERGYIGIFMDNKESYGFGWLDIGYDFESNTLTMYDWAFNDDGDLYAGHDTPPANVPGPTGLLALAVGAAGIRRKRNRVA
jgi:hypothetical protein